jgi:hypothetical protein
MLAAGNAPDAMAAIERIDAALGIALKKHGTTVEGRRRHGLRLALRWLREEVERGE